VTPGICPQSTTHHPEPPKSRSVCPSSARKPLVESPNIAIDELDYCTVDFINRSKTTEIIEMITYDTVGFTAPELRSFVASVAVKVSIDCNGPLVSGVSIQRRPSAGGHTAVIFSRKAVGVFLIVCLVFPRD